MERKQPNTPITGIPYTRAMRHSAAIGSLSTLRDMLYELGSPAKENSEHHVIADYCARATAFERRFGRDCLLDLEHPSVAILIENRVLSDAEVDAIKCRKQVIEADEDARALSETLKAEGRLF